MSEVTEAVLSQGVIAIVRSTSREQALSIVRSLMHSGLAAIEVSLVTPGALDVIRTSVTEAPAGCFIGVGTVLTVDDLSASIGAGARFAVAPIAVEAVIRAAVSAGIDIFPGAATPSEAVAAARWGASLVKVFPASLWSPAVLREVLTALPWLQTVPTGGVALDRAPEWIAAGAVALGIGSALSTADDPAAVARDLMAAIARARRV